MQRSKPPFRADHVGSLLRPTALKEARKRAGEIDDVALRAIEDREIGVIKKQEEVGLKSVTDGEYRRGSWQNDFLKMLPGVEGYVGERKIKFKGSRSRSSCVLSENLVRSTAIR
jgi:5-methyltetrahydropteroyltriglutamate--homocysteine methyltransferase